MRNAKSKGKPTCYHYGKLGHTTNICRRKHGMQNPKPKFIGYYFYYKKKGHQIHECRKRIKNISTTPRFEGYYQNPTGQTRMHLKKFVLIVTRLDV